MDVQKSNKVKGLSPEKLKAIEKFYHHSAYDRSENKNLYDEYYVYPYVGRFGIGLKIKMPLSCEVRYYNPDDSKPYYLYKIDSLNREEKKNVFAIRNTLLECMNEAKKVLGKSKLILE